MKSVVLKDISQPCSFTCIKKQPFLRFIFIKKILIKIINLLGLDFKDMTDTKHAKLCIHLFMINIILTLSFYFYPLGGMIIIDSSLTLIFLSPPIRGADISCHVIVQI